MLPELEFYFEASREFERGQVDAALWARALEIAQGNETAAKYQYLHLRVEVLSTGEPPKRAARAPRPPASVSPIDTGKSVSTAVQSPCRPGDGEAEFYAIAVSEFDAKQLDEQTWNDALVLAKGSYRAARHHYICLRMDSLRALSESADFMENAGA